MFFWPKTIHDLSLMFTDVFATICLFFFLFVVCWHKVERFAAVPARYGSE